MQSKSGQDFSLITKLKQIIPKRVKQMIPASVKKIFLDLYYFFTGKKRPTPLILEVHATDECNLNCKGCLHFSQLSPKNPLDIDDYERDLIRLSTLSGGDMLKIRILGGEPLLHHDINTILSLTRKYFHTGIIELVTNGILLPIQKLSFWETCKENNIDVFVSNYPIKIDNKTIMHLADTHGVKLSFAEQLDKIISGKHYNWCKIPIDLEGKQNPKKSSKKCWLKYGCAQLRKGKIYFCCRPAFIRFFNDYFSTDLKVSESDYIDIYNVKNIDAIIRFISSSTIPFCRYCKTQEIIYTETWAVSKKDINEYL